MSSLPKILAIVGTTASGKSDLGLALAKEFNGELISVDSRQIYTEMNIGTNKEPGEHVDRKEEIKFTKTKIRIAKIPFETTHVKNFSLSFV